MIFRKFPDIELFHNAVKAGEHYNFPVVNYRSKIKLHGTNAAVRIRDGVVFAQSRSRICTPENDNEGFAKWVEANKGHFVDLSGDVAIFGEWCGPGIMKSNNAINKIPNKIFAVFAIIFYDGDEDDATVVSDPIEIERFLVNKPAHVYVLPWQSEVVRVEYGRKALLQEVADQINNVVKEIEPSDPWVKKTFGVDGIAEGVVYYPVVGSSERCSRKFFSDFVFKAKGEEHRVVKTKEAVQVSPEVAKSINDFVTMFVTEARCRQGLFAIGGTASVARVGDFLKWFLADVQKESVLELEAASLSWEKVARFVQKAARDWFLVKAKEI